MLCKRLSESQYAGILLPYVSQRFRTRTQREEYDHLFQFLVTLAVILGKTFKEASTAFREMRYLCLACFSLFYNFKCKCGMKSRAKRCGTCNQLSSLLCHFPFLSQMPDPSVGSLNRRNQIALQIISNVRGWCQISSLVTETMTALERNLPLTVVRRMAQSLRRQNLLGLAPTISLTLTHFPGRAARSSVLHPSRNFHR